MRFVLPIIPGIGVAPQFVSLSLIAWYCNSTDWIELADILTELRNEENQ